jgi:hypothetical protein
MTQRRQSIERGFARGLAVACSIFVQGHGEHPGIVEALCACDLDTRAKLKALGVDDYDLKILKPIFAEIRNANQYARRKASG